MKTIKTLLLAIVMVAGMSLPAAAQFRFGVRAGVAVNDLHLDMKTFDGDNRAGFTGGLMAEFTVPVIGVGLDASVMYVRRTGEGVDGNGDAFKNNRDYVGIPINLKWKINVPVVSHIITPFITTGPEFDFLCSKSVVKDMENKKCDVSWNFGLGVELLKHLQVAASYGFGINDAVKYVDSEMGNAGVKGNDRFWTITAAYLF
ncbi:MAG: porin family protein [Candidatus Homeothermus sp.]|jgi:hypothetical protein BACCOPRO_00282|nr:porin family protein [Candidatus Homeothermus sp.]PWL59546.1 MAG: hypothetical protein DBY35_09615 [Bacteroidales bacterium]